MECLSGAQEPSPELNTSPVWSVFFSVGLMVLSICSLSLLLRQGGAERSFSAHEPPSESNTNPGWSVFSFAGLMMLSICSRPLLLRQGEEERSSSAQEPPPGSKFEPWLVRIIFLWVDHTLDLPLALVLQPGADRARIQGARAP